MRLQDGSKPNSAVVVLRSTTVVVMSMLLLVGSLGMLHWRISTFPPEWQLVLKMAAPDRYSYTAHILQELQHTHSTSCHEEHTQETRVLGLPEGNIVTLATGKVHRLWLISYNSHGLPRCAGGDFYETDLVSNKWHARPPTEDLGNGSYSVDLLVDNEFAGTFNFSATLLFDAFHGLDHACETWKRAEQTVFLRIRFEIDDSQAQLDSHNLKHCDPHDFARSEWAGRWSRPWHNCSCKPDALARYKQCIPKEHENCESGWCDGRVSRLESNGWVYSAHCAFRIFEVQEAWDCLSGRWLLFWGDSNNQDTIRNLLFFTLNISVPSWTTLAAWQIPRTFEEFFVNPAWPHQAVHISSIYNGNYQVDEHNMGLDSLQNPEYRESILRHFKGHSSSPDTVIMNSGLHDGARFGSVSDYVHAVEYALEFWESTWKNVAVGKRPMVLYRTTVAPAGDSRGMRSNPHKMGVFNKIMVEQIQAHIPAVRVVDAFDLTFPWHFDNNYSDGGHYGRPPGMDKTPWFGQPHYYFVDIMLGHILLNAICPHPAQRSPRP